MALGFEESRTGLAPKVVKDDREPAGRILTGVGTRSGKASVNAARLLITDGAVKVLEFGLAKSLEPTGALSANLSMSPTITLEQIPEQDLHRALCRPGLESMRAVALEPRKI